MVILDSTRQLMFAFTVQNAYFCCMGIFLLIKKETD